MESFGHYRLLDVFGARRDGASLPRLRRHYRPGSCPQGAAGLTTIDKIAKGGIAGNREQGLPASTVTVNWVRLG
jgi:hypothetical protein